MPFPASPEEWLKATEEMGKICAKHDSNKFMIDLLIAVADDLERAYKDNQQGGQAQCG